MSAQKYTDRVLNECAPLISEIIKRTNCNCGVFFGVQPDGEMIVFPFGKTQADLNTANKVTEAISALMQMSEIPEAEEVIH